MKSHFGSPGFIRRNGSSTSCLKSTCGLFTAEENVPTGAVGGR